MAYANIINLNSYGMLQSSKTEVLNLQSQVYSQAITMTNQNAHLHLASPQTTHLRLASPQSFTSALVLFSTICSFGRLSCIAQSLQEKGLLLHQKKFAVPPNWQHQHQYLVPFSLCWDARQSAKAALKAIAKVQAFAKRNLRLNQIKSKMPFTFQLIVGSKQMHQREPLQVLIIAWSSKTMSGHGAQLT
jgi:hypothetical protein